MKTKKLSLGIQDFENLRQRNCYYVDKTHIIKKLIDDGYCYFLSRPRRFGKSMIVSTIQCLFEGKKELFKGLYIYDKWQWSQNNIHPVIRLSFDSDELDTSTKISNYVKWQLKKQAKYYQLSDIDFSITASQVFGDVISAAHKKFDKKVVILIDEYDNPILEVLDNVKKAKDSRDCLRGIYGIIKGEEEHIQFVFITGISLFSKMNLFSRINNLEDISMLSEFSTICGYTEDELKSVFAEELKNYDFDKIRKWYDGCQWDAFVRGTKVFCPNSVLKLFKYKFFDNFWYEDSIPYYTYKILKSKNLNAIDLTDNWVDKKLLGRFEVEDIVIDSLLFQSGFLTLKDKKEIGVSTKYLLSYPNEEVKQSLSREYLEYLTGSDLSGIEAEGLEILKLLKKLDAEGMQSFINQIFKKVPYYWHGSHKEAKKDISKRPKQDIDNDEAKKMKLSKYECWYASLIYTMFAGYCVDIRVESVNNFGRSDMIVTLDNKVFVMEFKLAESIKDVERLTDEAIKQVKSPKYGTELIEGERSCFLSIGVMVFVQKERNINKVLIEKLKI